MDMDMGHLLFLTLGFDSGADENFYKEDTWAKTGGHLYKKEDNFKYTCIHFKENFIHSIFIQYVLEIHVYYVEI